MPSEILNADWAWIFSNCLVSISRVMVGVFLALILGTGLGFFRFFLPLYLQKNIFLQFLFEAPKYPPPIAWIPFVILLFGIGNTSAIIIVLIGAVSPIFTNTYWAVQNIPNELLLTARSLGLTGFKFINKFLIPAALPSIFNGIKIGLSMGWMSVIASELVSGQSGLGYSIQLNRLNLQYWLMSIDMFFIGFIGYVLNAGMLYIESKLFHWTSSYRNLSYDKN